MASGPAVTRPPPARPRRAVTRPLPGDHSAAGGREFGFPLAPGPGGNDADAVAPLCAEPVEVIGEVERGIECDGEDHQAGPSQCLLQSQRTRWRIGITATRPIGASGQSGVTCRTGPSTPAGRPFPR